MMMFSRPMTQIKKQEISALAENIRKHYGFLNQQQINYAAIEFFLEQNSLLQQKNKVPDTVTCGDLVAIIIELLILKADTDIAEAVRNKQQKRLWQQYNDILWPQLYPENYFVQTNEQQIKENVWESFEKRLRKSESLRTLCIINDKLCLRKQLFQGYLRSQMIVYSLKGVSQNEDKLKLAKYQQYFEKLLKQVFRWNLGKNLDNDNLKDIVSNKILEFLEEINKPDFKLTSTLNTYFYTFLKTGKNNFFTRQEKDVVFVPLDELTENEEKYLVADPDYADIPLTEKERKYVYSLDNYDMYFETVVKVCRDSKEETQNIIAMHQMGTNHKAIGRVVKKTDTNVGTIIHRFNGKLKNIMSNLQAS